MNARSGKNTQYRITLNNGRPVSNLQNSSIDVEHRRFRGCAGAVHGKMRRIPPGSIVECATILRQYLIRQHYFSEASEQEGSDLALAPDHSPTLAFLNPPHHFLLDFLATKHADSTVRFMMEAIKRSGCPCALFHSRSVLVPTSYCIRGASNHVSTSSFIPPRSSFPRLGIVHHVRRPSHWWHAGHTAGKSQCTLSNSTVSAMSLHSSLTSTSPSRFIGHCADLALRQSPAP